VKMGSIKLRIEIVLAALFISEIQQNNESFCEKAI